MHRTTTLPRDWWDLTAEASVGNSAEQDVVALRAEIDQLRRALVGPCGHRPSLRHGDGSGPLPPWAYQEPAG